MAILRIKDENGNVIEILAIKGRDGKDGDDYILTEADKREIAGMVEGGGGTGDLSAYALKSDVYNFKKAFDADVNDFSNPDELAKTCFMWTVTEDETIGTASAFVFTYGSNDYGVGTQIALGTDGKVYVRSENDNFAEWHCVSDEKYCKQSDFDTHLADVKEHFDSYSETHNELYQNDVDLGNGKVDKVEYNSTDGALQGRVYVVDRTNTQTTKELRVTSVVDSIPVRNHRGTFYVGTPTGDLEVPNKKYVDDAIAALKAEFTSGDEVSY